MVMFFTIAGETTQDDCIVMELDDDTISLNDVFEDEDGNECYRKFDRRTGRCLNDENFAGGRRWINRCWAKPDNYVSEIKPKPDISDFFDEELPF